jgi:pimeloyl-ACP methyl ester carboxylesterase
VPNWFYADAARYCRKDALAELGRVMSQLVTPLGPRRSLRQAWVQRAAEIPCPTLILWGRHDRTVPVVDEASFSRIANAKHQVVEDAGHLLMLEQPAVFLESLVSFLSAPSPDPLAIRANDKLGGDAQC